MINSLKIIIPVHEFNKEVGLLLERAVNSVPKDYTITISCKNGLTEKISKAIEKCENNVEYVETADKKSATDFCSLVNQAVGGTDWFSILEFDDEYTNIWFKNAEEYMEYKPEVSIFMPMEDVINYEDEKFLNFGNEAAWASSFSNEIGYIDNDCLQQFFDFYVTGSIFNTKDWETFGGLKPSLKVSFWYEFLLRMTHNGKKVFVIPKIGYKHYVNRPKSLYITYRDTMSEKESTWYFDTAKTEYFFKEDRNKTYQAEDSKEEGE